jgi:hypothetical protein
MGRRLLGQAPSLLGGRWRRCAAAVVLLRSQLARAIEARLGDRSPATLESGEMGATPAGFIRSAEIPKNLSEIRSGSP